MSNISSVVGTWRTYVKGIPLQNVRKDHLRLRRLLFLFHVRVLHAPVEVSLSQLIQGHTDAPTPADLLTLKILPF